MKRGRKTIVLAAWDTERKNAAGEGLIISNIFNFDGSFLHEYNYRIGLKPVCQHKPNVLLLVSITVSILACHLAT